MGKVMRHTLGASLNIRHNLSSSKGPKPLQLKLLTTYIPKTSAFTRSEERFSRNAETDLVCRLLLEKKKESRHRARVVQLGPGQSVSHIGLARRCCGRGAAGSGGRLRGLV